MPIALIAGIIETIVMSKYIHDNKGYFQQTMVEMVYNV